MSLRTLTLIAVVLCVLGLTAAFMVELLAEHDAIEYRIPPKP